MDEEIMPPDRYEYEMTEIDIAPAIQNLEELSAKGEVDEFKLQRLRTKYSEVTTLNLSTFILLIL